MNGWHEHQSLVRMNSTVSIQSQLLCRLTRGLWVHLNLYHHLTLLFEKNVTSFNQLFLHEILD